MPGFEIVGVVLGSIPLVIEGLRFYSQGLEKVENMLAYRLTFDNLYSDFTATLSRFLQECDLLYGKALALPYNGNDAVWKSVTGSEAGMDQMKREALEPLLLEKLGERDYEAYKSLFRHVNRRIRKLGDKLGLDAKFKAPFMIEGRVDEVLCKNFFSYWRCFKIGMQQGRFEELTRKIQHDIELLGKLTHTAIELQSFRNQRPDKADTRGFSDYWISLRSTAKDLHEGLHSSWSRACIAPHVHCVQLRLDNHHTRAPDHNAPRFDLSFCLQKCSAHDADLPWERRDMTVFSVNQPLARIVGFAQANERLEASDESEKCDCLPTTPINYLCDALGNPDIQQACLGFFTHERSQFHIRPAEEGSQDSDRELRPLHNAFHRTGRKLMQRKEQTTIALTLASAVLALYDTPWLQENWSLSSLFMDPRFVHDLAQSKIYVQNTFSPRTLPTHEKRDGDAAFHLLYRNRTIFGLGVALLELHNGQSLEECITSDDLNKDGEIDALTPFNTVHRLLGELKENERERAFTWAVNSCIQQPISVDATAGHNLSGDPFDLSNESFRERFYKDVVVQLENEYHAIFQGVTGLTQT